MKFKDIKLYDFFASIDDAYPFVAQKTGENSYRVVRRLVEVSKTERVFMNVCDSEDVVFSRHFHLFEDHFEPIEIQYPNEKNEQQKTK